MYEKLRDIIKKTDLILYNETINLNVLKSKLKLYPHPKLMKCLEKTKKNVQELNLEQRSNIEKLNNFNRMNLEENDVTENRIGMKKSLRLLRIYKKKLEANAYEDLDVSNECSKYRNYNLSKPRECINLHNCQSLQGSGSDESNLNKKVENKEELEDMVELKIQINEIELEEEELIVDKEIAEQKIMYVADTFEEAALLNEKPKTVDKTDLVKMKEERVIVEENRQGHEMVIINEVEPVEEELVVEQEIIYVADSSEEAELLNEKPKTVDETGLVKMKEKRVTVEENKQENEMVIINEEKLVEELVVEKEIAEQEIIYVADSSEEAELLNEKSKTVDETDPVKMKEERIIVDENIQENDDSMNEKRKIEFLAVFNLTPQENYDILKSKKNARKFRKSTLEKRVELASDTLSSSKELNETTDCNSSTVQLGVRKRKKDGVKKAECKNSLNSSKQLNKTIDCNSSEAQLKTKRKYIRRNKNDVKSKIEAKIKPGILRPEINKNVHEKDIRLEEVSQNCEYNVNTTTVGKTNSETIQNNEKDSTKSYFQKGIHQLKKTMKKIFTP